MDQEGPLEVTADEEEQQGEPPPEEEEEEEERDGERDTEPLLA